MKLRNIFKIFPQLRGAVFAKGAVYRYKTKKRKKNGPPGKSKNRRFCTCGPATRKEEKKMKKIFSNLVSIS